MKTSRGEEICDGDLLRFTREVLCYDTKTILPWDGRYFKVFYKEDKLFRTGCSGYCDYVKELKPEDTILELTQEEIDKYDVRF